LNYIQNMILFSIAERRFIFCVLGKIIKHNENVNLSKYGLLIFQKLYNDAKNEVN